jgi:hypothetical protein
MRSYHFNVTGVFRAEIIISEAHTAYAQISRTLVMVVIGI